MRRHNRKTNAAEDLILGRQSAIRKYPMQAARPKLLMYVRCSAMKSFSGKIPEEGRRFKKYQNIQNATKGFFLRTRQTKISTPTTASAESQNCAELKPAGAISGSIFNRIGKTQSHK